MEGDLARVLVHYDLGQLLGARRTEHGFVDENWIIDTYRGRYFLKRRHPRRRQSSDLVKAQHELIRWLHQAGFPAPVLVPTDTGETFLILGEELFEIEEFVEGQPYDHNRPAHLRAAARTLGIFHTLVTGFAPNALCSRKDLYHPLYTNAILDNMLEAWQIDDAVGETSVVQQIRDLVASLSAIFASHEELPHRIIHGDYHAGNLLFDGDRIVAVVDYDKTNWQPRVAEVAEALIYFSSPRENNLGHLVYTGFLEWEPFTRFLKQYATSATLDEREIDALPDYIGCVWLTMSLRRLLERYPKRPEEAESALQEVLALGTWAGANAQKMRNTAQEATKAAAHLPLENES
jgi:homoserine kinase type II